MIRHAVLGSVAVLGVALVVVVAAGGEDPYRVRLELASAGGLREGSEVRIGGLRIGKVTDLKLTRDELVRAELEVDPDKFKMGRGGSAVIRATNLLGEKFVYLDAGDLSQRQPSGVTIPLKRTSSSVELDEVLNILDADTRARFAVLINEAGYAFTGRRADFNALLREIPPGMKAATELVNDLARDNESVARLVESAHRFVARITAERRQIGRVVASADKTLQTIASSRAELGKTLQHTPGTLRAARRFLAELQAAATPLRPAAKNITAAAQPLTQVLERLDPFRRAAAPALDQATAVAPTLDRLARHAAPVVRKAVPTARALSAVVGDAPPLTQALDRSVDDALGLVEGWSRSIQGRDALGHVFRGRAIVGPELLRTWLQRIDALERPRAKRKARGHENRQLPKVTNERPAAAPAPRKLPPAVDRIKDAVQNLLGVVPTPKELEHQAQDLLDFLLAP